MDSEEVRSAGNNSQLSDGKTTASEVKSEEKGTNWILSESSESEIEDKPRKRPRHPPPERTRKCFRCAGELLDRHNESCPLKLICGNCGKYGHDYTTCRRPKPHSLVYNSQLCQTCKRPGHSAQECLASTSPLQAVDLTLVTCLKCGCKGHLNCGREITLQPQEKTQKQEEESESDDSDLWVAKRRSSKN